VGTDERTRLRVGVVGASLARGWGSAAHLPALAALDELEVTAVATTRLETARASAAAYGVPLAFADARELVVRPEVDVVAITVKVPEHATLIRAALAAGKHVFSEWPLGVDVAEAAGLAELAEAGGRQHIVGLQGAHAPGAAFVAELIGQGTIGRPLAVGVVMAGGPAGRRIPQANTYATDLAAGATVLSISTGHLLATLARAVGEPVRLSALVATVNRETTVIETGQVLAVTAPDQVVMGGFLENGAVVSIAVQGGASPALGFEVRIVGTEGTLVVRPATPGGIHISDWTVSVARPDGSTRDLPVPARFTPLPEGVPAGPPRNIALLYRELAGAIAEGRPAEPSFATAVRYHRLLDTIQRASDTGMATDVGH
jgi:predicted dehydrogenase